MLIDQLSKDLARAKLTITRKTQQLIEERQLNYQLKRRIRELEQEIERSASDSVARDSHNSSLPPSLDLPWKKVKRTRSLRKKSGLKVDGQFGHKGVTLRQVEQPDAVIVHNVEVCASCHAPLCRTMISGHERRQVFDISNGRMKVTEHRAEIKRCSACGTTTKARFPAHVRAPVQYGLGVLSRVVYLHLYQLIPIARTSETMNDLFDCPISAASIQRAGRMASGKLIKTEQRIKAGIRGSKVIGADKTGLRVASSNGYVHVARTEQLTHFGYDEHRGKAAMDEIGIIPQFRGTLVRDGYLSYSRYEQCRHSLCNAHLLRDLVFIEESSPNQKVWTTLLSELLLKIKDEVAEARANADAQLSEQMKSTFLRRYDRLVRKADRINPPASKR